MHWACVYLDKVGKLPCTGIASLVRYAAFLATNWEGIWQCLAAIPTCREGLQELAFFTGFLFRLLTVNWLSTFLLPHVEFLRASKLEIPFLLSVGSKRRSARFRRGYDIGGIFCIFLWIDAGSEPFVRMVVVASNPPFSIIVHWHKQVSLLSEKGDSSAAKNLFTLSLNI